MRAAAADAALRRRSRRLHAAAASRRPMLTPCRRGVAAAAMPRAIVFRAAISAPRTRVIAPRYAFGLRAVHAKILRRQMPPPPLHFSPLAPLPPRQPLMPYAYADTACAAIFAPAAMLRIASPMPPAPLRCATPRHARPLITIFAAMMRAPPDA
jgi:hypothetical protein